jgi:hypothetical protein
MLNAELYLKVSRAVTEAEKKACNNVIDRIITLANIARLRGVLALEAEMQDEPSGFLKMGIGLVVDGTDPEIVEQILLRAVFADGTDAGMLTKMLMADGILAIQNGFNPRIIQAMLGAVLGEKAVMELEGQYPSMREYFKFLNSLQSKQALPECAEFEALLTQMDDRAVRRVLREVDLFTLAAALRGCGYAAIHKIMDSLSIRTGLTLADEWALAKPTVEMILDCQQAIREKVTALVNCGEIVNKA